MLTKNEFYWLLGICAIPTWFYFLLGMAGGFLGGGGLEIFPAILLGMPWSLIMSYILTLVLPAEWQPDSIPLSLIMAFTYLIPLYINIYIIIFVFRKFSLNTSNRSSNIVH